MTISPTPEKIGKTVKACHQMVKNDAPLILEVARVIGLIISLFPGAEYGPLHYRVLEHDKTNPLAANAGNFNVPMKLSEASIQELLWWITYAPQATKHPTLPYTLNDYTDQCFQKGMGAVFKGRKIWGEVDHT